MMLQCPGCADLCQPGATRCDCGERLLPTQRFLDALSARIPAPTEPCWTCPNCLRSWRDPYCTECGANLIHEPMEVCGVEALA